MGEHGEEETRKLSSNAWLYGSGLKRFAVLPDAGMLLAVGDRVSFTTKKGLVFEADRTDIQVQWPRSGTGMLLYLTVNGQIYRLTLARPRGAANFDEVRKSKPKAAIDILTDGDYKDFILGTRDLHRGRASGKNWKAYFDARMDETAPPDEAAAPSDETAGQELE